jgi:esterase/lipase
MIWDFQEALSRRLLLWAALSIAAGALMVVLAGSPWWRGFGVQALVWGAIEAAIALLGQRSSRKRGESIAHDREAVEREARQLRRLLWINTGLDVLYGTGGFVLLSTLGVQNPFLAGAGWGIIVQCGFLFFFDLLHAVTVPKQEPALPVLAAFDGPEHQPFVLNGGEPAALLVHGFGGTPAEMRGLAGVLRDAGWTAQAILLPGFGIDIARLTETRSSEWLDAVDRAGQELASAGHRPLLLVGYSMGAALSLVLANTLRPAGMVALAPFRWEEKWWTSSVEFFVRPFLPIGFRPLRHADFGDSRLRQGIAKFMPGIDLDDPATQAAMRDFRVPMGLIDQVRALSRRVWAAAPEVAVPVLVVQGTRDRVARLPQTRRLVARLAQPVRYLEVDSDHDLTMPDNMAWPEVEAAVVGFAREIAGREPEAPRSTREPSGV